MEYALELMTAERATYVHEADGLGATELMLSARSPIAIPMAGEE